ncbi:hypothetical protein GGX14DRAFT_437563 [Mycena pura]|uniref:Uncharacterized protein n=1 Tax=Mycena pura TaxID=153505 RepID=A0AAD6VQE5_9AGAR|nr:hypothetical protein GGX14DRAFT_437563 [Mycena pura]
MAGNPNTLIVLGSSPDSYFVGHGRRHFIENMPEGFTNHAKTEMNISMTAWISMSPTMENWVCHNVVLHFNGNINQDIRDHLSGANGKAAAEFVAFPDCSDATNFFVKGKNIGSWNAVLPDPIIQELLASKSEVGANFDAALTGMLFGKGKTHILLFKAGFIGYVDDDDDSVEHPLYKVLSEYKEGWCIERGSTLCFYDSQYFFLKFKQPGSTQVKMHWNLPPHIAEKLNELREGAKQPEEKIALMQEDQMWMQVALMRVNLAMQMNTSLFLLTC